MNGRRGLTRTTFAQLLAGPQPPRRRRRCIYCGRPTRGRTCPTHEPLAQLEQDETR